MEKKPGKIIQGSPSNLRIELVEQSVRHIDALDRARIACRLLFRNATNNPVINSRFFILDADDANRGVFQGDTDIDGEADIEFMHDISSGIRRQLKFVFPHNLTAKKTFFLKEKTDARMQKIIDEALGRRKLGQALRALLEDIDDEKIGRFLDDYQCRIPKTTMDIIMGLIKRAQKMKYRNQE